MCLYLVILTFSIIIIIITVDNAGCLNLNFLVGAVGRGEVGRERYRKVLGTLVLNVTSRSAFATE